jgi:hypothetical protein
MSGFRRCAVLLAAASVAGGMHLADAQTFREHARRARDPGAAIEHAQADVLTLTRVEVAVQTLQTWVRTVGILASDRQTLTGCVGGAAATLLAANQRVRAFPPSSKSSIYQARVVSVAPRDGCTAFEARLSGPVYGDADRYVAEIIVDLGRYLAIPNEAIIEREGSQVVYVERETGRFEPVAIQSGKKGELYTEVVQGLTAGDRVVTLGSFFIDADVRSKSEPHAGAAGNAHHHH